MSEMRSGQREQQLLRQAVDWWESDRSRLAIIRVVWFLLFLASVAGTLYASWKGSLPTWALTLYAFFAVQLVFMTFMYAIKHSGRQEVIAAVHDLRRSRLPEWEFERTMLSEFARFCACTSAGMDPTHATNHSLHRRRLSRTKPPLPAVANKGQETRDITRRAIEERLTPAAVDGGHEEHARSGPVLIQFMAYSAETLIDLSREIVAQIDDTLSDGGKLSEGVEVRILVRDLSPEKQWLVPLAVDQRDDLEYGEDLRVRFRNVQRSAFQEFEDALKDVLPPKAVRFHVRGYRTEPLIKGLAMDRREGMFGLYAIDDLRNPTGWDYSGHAVDLCRVKAEGTYFENLGLELFLSWFEQLWDDDRLTLPINYR